MLHSLKTTVVILLFFGAAFARDNPAKDAVARLQKKIPVELVTTVTPSRLAALYTSASKELGRLVGGFLSGENLYLFEDGTYIYTEWGDVEVETIHDKGSFTISDGVLELRSAPEVTWVVPRLQRKYILVRRTTRPKEILIVGLERDVPYFEENAKDNPKLMLLIVSMSRWRSLDQKDSASLKAKLMREAWRPTYFDPVPSKKCAPSQNPNCH